jgi:hypothetical protein
MERNFSMNGNMPMQKQTEAGRLKERKPLPASGSVAIFPHFKYFESNTKTAKLASFCQIDPDRHEGSRLGRQPDACQYGLGRTWDARNLEDDAFLVRL